MAVNENREEFKVYNNVFDNFTVDVIKKLISQKFIDYLGGTISVGKEANVFVGCGADVVAVKIYRVKACNFNKMYEYLTQDIRFSRLVKNRRKVILEWVKREFRNLLIAFQNQISVPKPIVHRQNVIVMDFIGDKKSLKPAKLLKDDYPNNSQKFLEELLIQYRNLVLNAKLVHGDLSEFNILNFNDYPVLIDFSQATSVESPIALDLLKRDVEKISSFFKKMNVSFDFNEYIDDILKHLSK